MKKIILITAVMLGFTAAATAQPRAIGGRFGWGLEASYQHTVNGPDFIEADLGLDMFYGFGAKGTVTYNFVFAQPNWTDRGEWSWYAGPGASLGYAGNPGHGAGMVIAVAGQVGLEYTFWFPLQLSVDLRPQFGVHLGEHASYYGAGIYGFAPTLSVRYRF